MIILLAYAATLGPDFQIVGYVPVSFTAGFSQVNCVKLRSGNRLKRFPLLLTLPITRLKPGVNENHGLPSPFRSSRKTNINRSLLALQEKIGLNPFGGMGVPKKILIIEDDDASRELIGLALLKHGYEVAIAEDGIRGYDSAVFLRPDLIVTDISVPADDSLELIVRVRKTPTLANTPILVTTAFGSGRATFSLQQGASAYEPKPIDPHSFLATVDRLLTQCDTLRAA